MPNANITTTTLVGPWTRTQLADAIKTAMGNAGWTFDSETNPASTPYTIHFRRTFNGATYGTVYMSMRLSTAAGTASDIRAGSAPSTVGGQNHNAIVASGDVTFIAINHPELTGILWRQGTTVNSQLLARPKSKPAEWNEANFAYGALVHGTSSMTPLQVQPSALSIGALNWGRALSGIQSITNPFTGNVDVVPLLFLTASNVFAGLFSSDLVSATYPSGFGMTDSLQDAVTGRTYFVAHNGIGIITAGSSEP